VNDSWIRGRARESHPDALPQEQRELGPSHAAGVDTSEPNAQRAGEVQQQALEMLTLAQRTAEEHVAGAQRSAEKIHEDARAAAETMVRKAQAQADAVRREAEQVLADARAQATELAKEAQAHAESTRREGEKTIADAQAQAAEIAKEAEECSAQLKHRAQLRYEEMVGNLAAKREGLQQQIEALQEFDRDYRSRLLAFMQAQVRALWVDERQVEAEIEQPRSSSPALPARHPDAPDGPPPLAAIGESSDDQG
jgi:cell division septum initiation protein DivIVA